MTQSQAPHSSGTALSIHRVDIQPPRGLLVTSDALDEDGRMQDRYSAYHEDWVPGLAWSAVIEAQSYALIVEDPDAPMERPFVHWMLWNIPGTAIDIPVGLSRVSRPAELPGAVQGNNSSGSSGWYGAKPPEGHGVHHYHFQLFALGASLEHLGPDTSLEGLVSALKGVAIASGELIGTYERPDPIGDAPSPGRTGGYGSHPHADTVRDKETGRGGLDQDDLDRHAPHAPNGEVQRS
jgi:Raf kinase inhibitor-like YbhB/YbcL family protein